MGKYFDKPTSMMDSMDSVVELLKLRNANAKADAQKVEEAEIAALLKYGAGGPSSVAPAAAEKQPSSIADAVAPAVAAPESSQETVEPGGSVVEPLSRAPTPAAEQPAPAAQAEPVDVSSLSRKKADTDVYARKDVATEKDGFMGFLQGLTDPWTNDKHERSVNKRAELAGRSGDADIARAAREKRETRENQLADKSAEYGQQTSLEKQRGTNSINLEKQKQEESKHVAGQPGTYSYDTRPGKFNPDGSPIQYNRRLVPLPQKDSKRDEVAHAAGVNGALALLQKQHYKSQDDRSDDGTVTQRYTTALTPEDERAFLLKSNILDQLVANGATGPAATLKIAVDNAYQQMHKDAAYTPDSVQRKGYQSAEDLTDKATDNQYRDGGSKDSTLRVAPPAKSSSSINDPAALSSSINTPPPPKTAAPVVMALPDGAKVYLHGDGKYYSKPEKK